MATTGGMAAEDVLINVKTTAKMLGVSPSLVYKMAKRREIASVRIRGRILFSIPIVKRFIDQRQIAEKPMDEWV
jgi:excisionase family DNA binding protein